MHIMSYASLLIKDSEAYNKRMRGYVKNKVNPLEFDRYFNDVKKNIIGE